VQRGHRSGVGGSEALVVGQFPEQVPVGDKRQRIFALVAGRQGEAVSEPVDDLD